MAKPYATPTIEARGKLGDLTAAEEVIIASLRLPPPPPPPAP